MTQAVSRLGLVALLACLLGAALAFRASLRAQRAAHELQATEAAVFERLPALRLEVPTGPTPRLRLQALRVGLAERLEAREAARTSELIDVAEAWDALARRLMHWQAATDRDWQLDALHITPREVRLEGRVTRAKDENELYRVLNDLITDRGDLFVGPLRYGAEQQGGRYKIDHRIERIGPEDR